ncbi:MAG TPA: methyltransferase domain-containing protein [Flavisolibacter sp.]|nr:methyltransferase domain-containing protein [Flavisolibacter sp.]
MPSFRQRTYEKELLDRDDIPFEDIKQNMQELDLINARLGGHAITLSGFKSLTRREPGRRQWHLAELGCGGGDNLRVIRDWAHSASLQIRLTGIDINPECISYASGEQKNHGISFIRSDYRDITFGEKPDIVFSSLFCHHFTDEELVYMLRWMKANSSSGFFINDLHRHPLAYHSIALLTRLFSRSYLVKNDAPLSVRRGFKKNDWRRLLSTAGISDYSCRWRWAFRWLITCYSHAYTKPL